MMSGPRRPSVSHDSVRPLRLYVQPSHPCYCPSSEYYQLASFHHASIIYKYRYRADIFKTRQEVATTTYYKARTHNPRHKELRR